MSRLMMLVLSLSLALSHNVLAESFTASVDRNGLRLNETLELTLESDNGTQFGKPDLSPLEPLFDILATRQVNHMSTTPTGSALTLTRWIVTLQPRQQGFVIVPPLTLGNAQSQPIRLQVSPADERPNQAPLYIDAQLDQSSVYVQAQAILTLRIYHTVSLYDDSQLSPLQVTDARVEQLGEPRTYEKTIDGIRHGVIELRYAIYPQKSGALEIPGQVFSATPALPSHQTRNNPFAARTGKPTQIRSANLNLQVKAKPVEYPANHPWLPAKHLSLTERYTPDSQTLTQGDSLTRQVLIKAQGLSSAQLPPLLQPKIDGLKRYPDQPLLQDERSENGITGSREETEALVSTDSGDLELPAIEWVWWNTQTDTLERSTLPARQLHIRPEKNTEREAQQLPSLPRVDEPQPLIWPWKVATLLLALTSLLGFGLWWHARQQPAILRSAQTGPSPRSLLDDLRRACQSNDTQATRQALDAWARQAPETLAQMGARFTPLGDALNDLNGALYSETGQHWQGQALWQAISELPALTLNPEAHTPSPLPPLYPR